MYTIHRHFALTPFNSFERISCNDEIETIKIINAIHSFPICEKDDFKGYTIWKDDCSCSEPVFDENGICIAIRDVYSTKSNFTSLERLARYREYQKRKGI